MAHPLDEVRPKGKYEILLDASDCKVRRITVKPGGILSYQYHNHRSENWTIVSGEAIVTIDDIDYVRKPSEHIYLPQGCKHRVRNETDVPVVFIEVQTGTYSGEDDIVRLEDIYDRVSK